MAVGMRKRKKGLFGQPMAQDMQPIDTAPGMQVAEAVEPKKKKSVLPYALAAIEDTLSRQMGYAPQGVARLNAMQSQQQQTAAAQAAELRKRSLDRADRQWEWQNKPQTSGKPHYWETNDGSLGMVGADGKPSILYQDPTEKVNWVKSDNGDGTFTMVPMSRGGAQAPTGELPSFTADDWDSAGGASGNASGGF